MIDGIADSKRLYKERINHIEKVVWYVFKNMKITNMKYARFIKLWRLVGYVINRFITVIYQIV